MFYSIKKNFNRFLVTNKYRFTGAITNVRTQNPVAALTFDDGPNRDFTTALLDVLDRHNAKGTFFVAGERIAEHFDILERMDRSGHCIGNHSWDHHSYPLLKVAERRKQIRHCRKALGKFDSGLFRPPFGHLNLWSCFDIHRYGYKVIGWSGHAEDWLAHRADVIYEKLLARLKPGQIVLLHDNLIYSESPECFDRGQTISAVDKLLSKKRQFQFVTVNQLLKMGIPVYRPWRLQIDKNWLGRLIHSSS